MMQSTCCRQTRRAASGKVSRRNYPLFALLVSLLLLCNTPQAVAPLHAQADRAATPNVVPMTPATLESFFDQLVAQQLNDAHVVGATVAVVKDGALLFAKGYGAADRAQKIPVVADQTLFFPGSTGKLFTWTALMQLVEQGKLDLQADINQYLDFTIPATYPEPITIAHLLTHTAGFEEQFEALLAADQADVRPLGEFLRATLPARVYAPGTTFAYSNYATALAGYIIERVAGEPYAQYITDHILVPLAMKHSAAVQPLPPSLMADLAKGYHYRNGQYTAIDFEWVAAAPAAPIHTTATDMANFMIAYLNQGRFGDTQILQPATTTAMLQKQFAHDPHVNGMGYGFMISTQNDQTILFFGQFTYFKISTYQTVLFQLLLAAGALLIMLTGVIAWPIAWIVQRRRGAHTALWTVGARWTASLLALFNIALLGWLLLALLAYADTLVYPAALMVRLTQLWWINLPAVLALLTFTVVAWRRSTWHIAWRIHYTLVALAALLFVAFLLNWHLLAGL